MVKTDPRARKRLRDAEQAHEKEKQAHPWMHPFAFGEKFVHRNGHGHGDAPDGIPRSRSGTGSPVYSRTGTPSGKPKKRKRDKLRPDMIRRVDAPVRVNQMNVGGFLSENGSLNRRTSLDFANGAEPYSLDPNHPPSSAADGGVLEKTATRTDSPTQMSTPADTPGIREEPPSPRATRRVSLAELPVMRHEREAHDSSAMTPIQEAASRPASIASSVFEESSNSSSDSDEGEAVTDDAVQGATSALGPSRSRRMSDPAHLPSHTPVSDLKREFKRVRTMDPPKPVGLSTPLHSGGAFPRTQTIEIREPVHPDRPRGYSSAIPHLGAHIQPDMMRRRGATTSTIGAPLSRSM